MNNDKSMLADCYRIGGSYFPVPDETTDKGDERGPSGTVDQSDKQKAPRLNASDGYGPEVRGKEGKAFPPANNSKTSQDEQPTFAGDRDSNVSVNLVSGQINSAEVRLVPVPEDRNDNKTRPLVKFKRAKGYVRENRI